jgi:hypothetical protein
LDCEKRSLSDSGALSPMLGTGATSFFGGVWKLLSSRARADLISTAAAAMMDGYVVLRLFDASVFTRNLRVDRF